MWAIKAGIFNASIKEGQGELEDQKTELKSGTEKEHIMSFLHRSAGLDHSDFVGSG